MKESSHIIYVAEAAEEAREPAEVLIRVEIDWTEERIKEEIHKVFPDAPIMEKVAWCESRLQPDAFNPTNGSNDRGLFQISEKYHKNSYGDRDMFDIQENIRYARELYDRNGLKDWSASKHCWQ